MKAIKCPDCGSTDTEYGVYELAAYRSTVLDDRAETAADAHCVEWKVSRREQLEGFVDEHFMCNDCFATVQCVSPSADNWKAVEINNDREEVSNA
jgi:hypothetical protein